MFFKTGDCLLDYFSRIHTLLYFYLMIFLNYPSPNKSLEPTAVGAGSSAIAVHVASRRWLSFFR